MWTNWLLDRARALFSLGVSRDRQELSGHIDKEKDVGGLGLRGRLPWQTTQGVQKGKDLEHTVSKR